MNRAMKKLSRPDIQTAVVGVWHSIIAVLMLLGYGNLELYGALTAVLAAVAFLLSRWFAQNGLAGYYDSANGLKRTGPGKLPRVGASTHTDFTQT